MKNNQSKKWLKWLIALLFISFTLIVSVNYYIDPLWFRADENKFNQVQASFNERQQKTNFIYNNGLDNYDGIVIGSSRTRPINQNYFKDMKIYNYSASGLRPFEYKYAINFVKKIKKQNLKHIILGIDFSGTNKDKKFDPINYKNQIEKIIEPWYKFKMLFSLDTLKYSLINIKNNYFIPKSYYNRNNIAFFKTLTKNDLKKEYTINLKNYMQGFKEYSFDNNYAKIIYDLRVQNPKTKFIIFTSPTSADFQKSILINLDKFNEYSRWLKILIKKFGSIYNFMDINSVTLNINNYRDASHLYADAANLIALRISDPQNSKVPKDFGKILNKDNIDEFLAKYKKDLENYQIQGVK